MLSFALIYITLAFGALIALATMILKIGALIGKCPGTDERAHAVAVTIATGFSAIGGGGVILIGVALPIMANQPVAALMLALGFASLCLGLGFTHAVGTLRALVNDDMPIADMDQAAT